MNIKIKHSDHCTHINNPEDRDVLTRKLFNVNMRLFNTSIGYRTLVLDICKYIEWNTYTTKEGYKKPHGFSGANAGIPFNIIGVNRGATDIMINPRITAYYGEISKSESNCGSLTLKKPIEIWRHEFIDIEYYRMNGKKCVEKKIGRGQGGYTIQHEVDHNLGILITERQ